MNPRIGTQRSLVPSINFDGLTAKRGIMSLQIIVWNVQHGSAAYIRTPNGKHIAIDLGAGDEFSPLEYLWQNGIRRLDHVTITHPHMDHIDDILYFDEFKPKTLSIPSHLTEHDIRASNPRPSPEAEQKIKKYLEIGRRYSTPVGTQDNVALLQNNGGVSIQRFISTQASTSNLNNHSVVTVLEYSGVKILIPGDNEPPSWEDLLNRRKFVTAIKGTRVLVAPHHGRESGFHSPLFDHFHPRITLISDGRSSDTSATARYTKVTKGWKVHKENGTTQPRKCVTTRKDGTIQVTVKPGARGRKPTLDVLID